MPVYKDDERKTWYFKCRYKDMYGRDKQKMQRGFKKRGEAIQAEADFISGIKNAFTDEVTFDEVFKHELSHKKLRSNTIAGREAMYERHIKPVFGDIKIKDIDVKHIVDFKVKMEQHFKSPSSAKAVYGHLIITLNHAGKYFGLRDASRLRADTIKIRKTILNFIRRDDFDRRIEKIEHHKELFQLLFYTGLRVSEGLALTWAEVDLDGMQIHVKSSLSRQTNKRAATKTESSIGYVPLPSHIKDMLIALKARESKEVWGFTDEYFVFGGLKPTNYLACWRAFKKTFPEYRVHDLRHSYASFLINKGVDIYLVKELMRHANINETADTYGHLYTERKHEAMRVFD